MPGWPVAPSLSLRVGVSVGVGGGAILLSSSSAELEVRVPKVGSAWSQAQTSPESAFVLHAGHSWGTRRGSFCPCPANPRG